MSEITAEEIPDFEDEPTNAQPTDGLECAECGKTFEHSGRGRKPKRCPECRVTKTAPTGRKSPVGSRKTALLEKQLAAQFATVGSMVYLFNQIDGLVILQGSDNLAKSLADVAETNPKVRKALENMVTVSAWGAVAVATAQIAIPIAQNHKLIPVLPGQVPNAGEDSQ